MQNAGIGVKFLAGYDGLEDRRVMRNALVENVPDARLPAPTGEALLPKNDDFCAKFNRTDFMFDHGLAHHPMFELPALAELAKRVPKYENFVYWQNGRVQVNDKWGANPAKRLSLEETISGIAHNDSLVILKHAEQDPVHGPVLQEILQRIYSFTSPAAQADIVLGESLIFINSPNRKTAYHLDLESNFLLQVAGEKLIHVFDCSDRSLTPHVELENFCGGDHNGAVYKPARESDCHFHHLTPGHGVHFPSMGPHWVQNGDQVSVSININFDLVSVHHRLKRVYRVNRVIRRLGIEPTAPGSSAVRDAVKEKISAGVSGVLETVRNVKGRDPSESYPTWRPTPVTHFNDKKPA
jgi:hypothetical protein